MKRKKPVIAITIEIILAIAIMSGLLLSVFMVLDERKGELNPAKAQGEVLGDDTISGDESTEVIQEFLETDFAPDGSDNYGTDGETAREDMDSMSDGEGVNIEDNDVDAASSGMSDDGSSGMSNDGSSGVELGMENTQNVGSSPDSIVYLCSYSFDREITAKDWKQLEKQYANMSFPGDRCLAQMVINEMYARLGYEFKDEDLENYFSQKPWYKAVGVRYHNMREVYAIMTDIQFNNVLFLKSKVKE